MIIKLFLIFALRLSDTPEQVALDYFMTNIFPIEYTSKTRPKFNGSTERGGTSFDILRPCFKETDSDEKIHGELFENKTDNAKQQRLNIAKWKKSFRTIGTNEIKVYLATKIRDRYYINVTINYKANSDCYFIELNDKLEVTRYCKTGLIY